MNMEKLELAVAAAHITELAQRDGIVSVTNGWRGFTYHIPEVHLLKEKFNELFPEGFAGASDVGSYFTYWRIFCGIKFYYIVDKKEG